MVEDGTAVTAAAGTTGATCVALDVRGPRAAQVARLVEGSLGWQVVASDDAVLPARCLLVDVGAATAAASDGAGTRGGTSPAGLPQVLLVGIDDDPVDAARAAAGVAAVVGPDPTPAALRAALARIDVGRRAGQQRPWRTVGAAAGGVGATTVAAALAGLRAWGLGPTLLAASGPVHVARAPVVGPSDLPSPATWAAAAPAAAVEDLRVVRWRTPPAGPVAAAVGLPTVAEVGVVDPSVVPLDVLVVRPDAAGRAAVAAAAGAPAVVVVDRGPLDRAAVAGAATGLLVTVGWSPRVAAAAARGRLPAGLPGRWLRQLLPLVGDGASS